MKSEVAALPPSLAFSFLVSPPARQQPTRAQRSTDDGGAHICRRFRPLSLSLSLSLLVYVVVVAATAPSPSFLPVRRTT